MLLLIPTNLPAGLRTGLCLLAGLRVGDLAERLAPLVTVPEDIETRRKLPRQPLLDDNEGILYRLEEDRLAHKLTKLAKQLVDRRKVGK